MVTAAATVQLAILHHSFGQRHFPSGVFRCQMSVV
jgi:hypothetical protein